MLLRSEACARQAVHERTIGIRNCKSKIYFHFNIGIAFCSAQFCDRCLWTVPCCLCNIVSPVALFFRKLPVSRCHPCYCITARHGSLRAVDFFIFHILIHQLSSTCTPFYWRNPICYFRVFKTHLSRQTVRNKVKNSRAPLGGKPDWGLLRLNRCMTSWRLKVESIIRFTTTTSFYHNNVQFATFILHII